jgi:hypothetical protein
MSLREKVAIVTGGGQALEKRSLNDFYREE